MIILLDGFGRAISKKESEKLLSKAENNPIYGKITTIKQSRESKWAWSLRFGS